MSVREKKGRRRHARLTGDNSLDSVQPSFLAMALRTRLTLQPPNGRERVPRPFCGMGVCRECEAVVGGRVVATCLEAWSD